MKANIVLIIISLMISTLVAYALYNLTSVEDTKNLLTIGSGLSFLLTLSATMGISFENKRAGVNIKVLSVVFFILLLISNLIFTFITFSTSSYVITNGLLLVLWFLSAYSIARSKQ